MRSSEGDLGMDLVYDVSQNIAKIEEHRIDGKRRRVVVHRKGEWHFPPAWMRSLQSTAPSDNLSSTRFYGNCKLDTNRQTWFNGAHVWINSSWSRSQMSRSKARRDHTEQGVKKELDSNGIFVKSLTREGVVEEAPGAYKDVDRAEVSHKMGIATKVARLLFQSG